ncbi:hypothetical protein [Pseudoalteromonas tunicata]|jgi:hypothetical protein|uniref:Uncharacterized protein n=1 Tax=Pseudoalteromonas tunicata D2 TaxID=87626 RepID=A4CFU3_9GAMM|nr:hypothetical protein [Pseudoalteromonas tunicata]AXT31782.1 hypothetical protein D1819_13770 [Pseudoalteromonas tunicata]EAR26380.1 hypothetical protein PTD2_00122 [Pseudoalteromonas tunicata D2]
MTGKFSFIKRANLSVKNTPAAVREKRIENALIFFFGMSNGDFLKKGFKNKLCLFPEQHTES